MVLLLQDTRSRHHIDRNREVGARDESKGCGRCYSTGVSSSLERRIAPGVGCSTVRQCSVALNTHLKSTEMESFVL